jgi:two-component sensor histidine kinase
MIKKLAHIWNTVNNNRYHPVFSFEEKKRKKLLHHFSLVSIILSSLFLIGLNIVGAPMYSKLVGVFIFGSGVFSLFLIRYRFLFTGAFILVITGPVSIVILSDLYGRTGAEFYLFPLFTLVFYIFRNIKVTSFLGIYLAISLILAVFLGTDVELPSKQVFHIQIVFYINLVSALIISYILLRLFIKEHERYQFDIETKNNQLKISIDNINLKNKEVQELLNEIEVKNSQLNNTIDIANQKNAEIQLLLSELCHRTKNNLQLVSSIVNMESAKITDPTARNSMEDTKNRIYSMALLHQKLYVNNKLNSFSLTDYTNDLINYLTDIFDDRSNPVKINRYIDNIEIKIDNAIHIGLIINEILTNSFKHGISKINDKFINVSVIKDAKNDICISISDSGEGIKKIAEDNYSKTFGASLIYSMASQMNGEISFSNHGKNQINIKLENVQ